MPSKNAESLQKARLALQSGDQKAAAKHLNQILQKDIQNVEAWQLLYETLGRGEAFETFQKQYAKKNFPKQVNELTKRKNDGMRRVSLTGGKSLTSRPTPPPHEPAPELPPPSPEKKPGFFARLFSLFKRKPKTEPPPQKKGNSLPQKEAPTVVSSTAPENHLRLASLKNNPTNPSLREELEIPAPPPSPPTVQTPLSPTYQEVVQISADEKIRVLVVDDIAQTRENLIKLLSLETNIQVIASARTGGEGVSMALQHDPDVILMDINMPDMDGLEATRLIKAKIPYVQVVILTVQDDPSYMREAIVAGARDFLIKPPMIEELVSAVQRAYVIAREEKARIPPPPMVSYADKMVPLLQTDGSKRIISVYAPKGGVGCTTLVSNLAVALSSDSTPVIIVDACFHFGGVGISFNERSKHSIIDLVSRVEHLDAEVVNGVVTTHAGSGVRLLLAPEKVNDAELVDASQIGPLLDYLATLYTYVLVDTSSELNEHTLAVLDASDLVLLATTQDIPSLDRLRRFLDLAPAIGLNKERFWLLLNRYNEKINISPERISQNFKHDVVSVIPYDPAVVSTSTNQGTPFMMDKKYKGRPIYKNYADLAEQIVKEAEASFA